MPSGRTHDRITLWSLPWVGGLSFCICQKVHLSAIVVAAFLFSGLMFGPDLDIHSVQFKRWGKLRWIWLPYQNCLRHRSGMSHGLMIGTTLRILYLFSIVVVLVILAVAAAQLIWGFDWNWQQFALESVRWLSQDYPQEAIALFVGLELGAMSHSFSDWIGSAYKRYQKNHSGVFKSKTRKPSRAKRSKSPASRRRNKRKNT